MKLGLALVFILLRLIASAQMHDSAKVIIHFSFNQFQITNTAKSTIDSFLNLFNTTHFAITGFTVAGHTDQIGSHFYNNLLSLQRANATTAYLSTKGFDKSFIQKMSGYGKQLLFTKKMSEEERLLNRRVEITCYCIPLIKPAATEKVLLPPVTGGKDAITLPKTIKIAERIEDTATKVGDNIELPYILFVGGMHEFLRFSYPYLDELLAAMQNNAALEIEIQGHICCAPNEEDGLDFGTGRKDLSVARAKAVYDYLRNNGINKSRMSYRGFGHQFPITLERTEAEKTRNRRVEIKIIKK